MSSSAAMQQIRLVSPLSVVQTADKQEGRRVRTSLNGAVLGLVTNVFRGEDLPGAVASEIKSRFGCTEIVRYEKPILSHPAGVEALTPIAERADGVIVGTCG